MAVKLSLPIIYSLSDTKYKFEMLTEIFEVHPFLTVSGIEQSDGHGGDNPESV